MKYATLNLILGAAIISQSFLYHDLLIPLCWLGTSFCTLGLAYLTRSPRLLGKQTDGTIAWWSWAAFLPLHCSIQSVWLLSRYFSSESPTDTVAPRLIVGRRLLASEAPSQVELIVDLTSEFPEPLGVRRGRDYRLFPMLDASVPDYPKLREFIESLPDVPTYVHCAQGHGRTGLFSIVYLVERGFCATSTEAEALLTAARPGINLNHEQRKFIAAHYSTTRGRQ